MSSSMRNAVQRRNHRERGQVQERGRLGLLEKKKDWKLRAQDHKKKAGQLKSLRVKAAERNEDEFNFGMLSREGPGSKLSRGKAFTGTINGDRGNRSLSVETVRLLKTQDKGYLATMRNIAAKEVRQLEERYILAGGADRAGPHDDEEDDFNAGARMKAKKIVFFDAAEEREEAVQKTAGSASEEVEDRVDDGAEGADSADAADLAAQEAEAKAQHLVKLGRRLQLAKKKLNALATAEQALDEQRAKMAKTATSGGFTKSGKRIKVRERKR